MKLSSVKHSFFGAAVVAVLIAGIGADAAWAQKGGRGGGGGGGGGGRGNAGQRSGGGGGGGGGGPRVNIGGNAGGGAQINRGPMGNPGGGPRIRVEGNANVQGGGNVPVNPDAGRQPRGDRPQLERPQFDRPPQDAQRNNSIDPRNNVPRDFRDGARDPRNLTDAQRDAFRDQRDAARAAAAANGNVAGATNPIPRHSFYRGAWNNNNNFNNATRARAAAALGLPYGAGYNNFGYGNLYGYNNWGGNNTTGNLLRLGLSLAGYGGNYGAYGLGGYGAGGLGGYGLGGYGLGGYGGYGLYGGYPIGWGLGGMGLGSLAYSSGYLPYMNPYYNSGLGGYNYSRPLMMASNVQTAPSANDFFNAAVEQFKAGDYTSALTSVNNAIGQDGNDPAMHEFRALTLFALKNYTAAAATVHSVLAVGPGWNWDTMSSFYPDVAVYEAQLRTLEQSAGSSNAADQHFLLAYHYLSTGHPDAAAGELAKVVELNPNDKLAADLKKMNEMSQTAQAAQPSADQTAQAGPTGADVAPALPPTDPNAPQPPQQPAAEVKSIDAATLVGTWHAQRDDGSKFDLTLSSDKQFTWTVHHQGQEQKLTGTYEVEKDLLALQSQQAGSMVAQVSQPSGEQFQFKLLGAPQDDQGLAFNK
ncbi:MAG: hypothetical protein QM775_12630 [Pirellulales bacterium]